MRGLIELFSGLVARIKGAYYIDEKALREIARELQRALLKADVDVDTVYSLVKRVEERLRSAELPEGISIKDYALYVLYSELVNALGGEEEPDVSIKKRPYKLMLIGVEGCGKTTSAAKIARFYMSRGLSVGLVETDVYRPGAQDQLRQLAEKIGARFYGDTNTKDPREIAKRGVESLMNSKVDLIIIDTAGRHANEQELMSEVKAIYEACSPDEVMLVVDATLGKHAARHAEEFRKYVPVHSIFISKMDSTARGGGALIAAIRTGAKIKFLGVGEDVDDIEVFSPRRFALRLLGLECLEGLIERIKMMREEKKILEEIEKDIEEGRLTLITLMRQIEMLMRLGPLSKVLQLLPTGMTMLLGARRIGDEQIRTTQEKLRRWYAIMKSMTREELLNPEIIDSSRARRIARGSGTTPKDVKELLSFYNMTKRMLSEIKRRRELRSLLRRTFSSS